MALRESPYSPEAIRGINTTKKSNLDTQKRLSIDPSPRFFVLYGLAGQNLTKMNFNFNKMR
jgi:hypothetical protein